MSFAQPCWRQCEAANVDHSEVAWFCPVTVQFCGDIRTIKVRILGYDVPKLFVVLYFGYFTGKTAIREDRFLFKILLAACKKGITTRWFKAEPPKQDEWLKIVTEIYNVEQ